MHNVIKDVLPFEVVVMRENVHTAAAATLVTIE